MDPRQNECGGAHVFCPEGSALPIAAREGYHTIQDETIKLYTIEVTEDITSKIETCKKSNGGSCLEIPEPLENSKL